MRKSHKKSISALVDIIIVTGGRFDLLSGCLNSIKAHTTVPYNIILIDNASPMDERKASWEHLFENVFTKRLSNPVGFAEANNEGARMGNAPLILLLNDDVELTSGCIDKMVETMDDPQYGVVGAKLLFPENSSSPIRPAGKVQHIGHALDIKAQVTHPLVGWSKDHPKTCVSREVFSVTGACLMTRRNLWNKVKGLDTVYGAGCLSYDSIVFTSSGIKYLGNLVGKSTHPLSDMTIAGWRDNKPSTLAYYNGLSSTKKVFLEKGYSIHGTPNHKIIVMNSEGVEEWRELSSISVGDYVAVKSGSDVWGTNYLDSDYAYLLGLYIAEGCFDKKRVTITTSDGEIQNFLVSFGFRKAGKYHYRYNKVDLGEKLQSFGVNKDHKSHQKVLSDFVLSLNRESMRMVLRGMFDGDGCAKNNGLSTVTYSSSSFELIRQIQMILLNFGVVSSAYEKHSPLKRLSYTLEILTDVNKFYDYIGFGLNRKQAIGYQNTKIRRGYIIPNQRQYLLSLGNKKKFIYGSSDYISTHHNQTSHIRENTLANFLQNNQDLKNENEYIHLESLLTSGIVWLRVSKIIDIDNAIDTYDLHVPGTHDYIANGVVVHNTYEEVDYCLKVKQLGGKIYVNTDAIAYHYTGATSEKKQVAFPIQINYMTFISRWSNSGLLQWDDFKYY